MRFKFDIFIVYFIVGLALFYIVFKAVKFLYRSFIQKENPCNSCTYKTSCVVKNYNDPSCKIDDKNFRKLSR